MFRNLAYSRALTDGVRFDRNPTCLTRADIDPPLWEVVTAINGTARIWSRFCCAGHFDHEAGTYRPPYLQVVCEKRDLPLLSNAATAAQNYGLGKNAELEICCTVYSASPNWVAGSLHVYDPGETPRETLPGARDVVLEFGRLLVRTCSESPPVRILPTEPVIC